MKTFARAHVICAKVDEWNNAGTLDADQYNAELIYFRQRYFSNGVFTEHFFGLKLRPADQPSIISSVLNGSNETPRDKVWAVLMIVWRYRNNLFHGEKWAYYFRDQHQNFTQANAVLIS